MLLFSEGMKRVVFV